MDVHSTSQHLGRPLMKDRLDVLGHHRLGGQTLRCLTSAAEECHGVRHRGRIVGRVSGHRAGRGRGTRQARDLLIDDSSHVQLRIVVGRLGVVPSEDVL